MVLTSVMCVLKADQIMPRRRSGQNLASDQKFYTIARGNRDARSEPRDMPVPPMVPRSSTDHSLHFHSHTSPNHLAHSPPLSAYAPLNAPGAVSPAHSWGKGSEPVNNMPLYACEAREEKGYVIQSRHTVYRGPMFQRPPRRASSNVGNIPTPDLRESSV
jgi:hypothetical protein